MSEKRIQTRRSISVSGATYDSLTEYCRLKGKTMSGVTEELLKAFLGGSLCVAEGLGAVLVEKFTRPANGGGTNGDKKEDRSPMHSGSPVPGMDHLTREIRFREYEKLF